jgi:hypothetical protein
MKKDPNCIFHAGYGFQTLRNSMSKMTTTSHSTRVQWRRKQAAQALPRVPPTVDHRRKRPADCRRKRAAIRRRTS